MARWIGMWGLLRWIDRKCVTCWCFWQPGENPACSSKEASGDGHEGVPPPAP